MSEDINLKSCPFCGSDNVDVESYCDDLNDLTQYVECQDCSARGESFYMHYNQDYQIKNMTKNDYQYYRDIKRRNEKVVKIKMSAMKAWNNRSSTTESTN